MLNFIQEIRTSRTTRKTIIDRGSRSDRPHYHPYVSWMLPLAWD